MARHALLLWALRAAIPELSLRLFQGYLMSYGLEQGPAEAYTPYTNYGVPAPKGAPPGAP
jgi:hypothetical protein